MSEGTHSYYDWQLSTLMLAYDVAEPVDRDHLKVLEERQRKVEMELHEMAHHVLPKSYLENPQEDFPPAVVVLLTRATIERAVEIMGKR